jgi:fructose-bisphosphate aldolase class 1
LGRTVPPFRLALAEEEEYEWRDYRKHLFKCEFILTSCSSGLLEEQTFERKHQTLKLYKVTEKGHKFIHLYDEVEKILKSS